MSLYLQDGPTRLVFTRTDDHVLISAIELGDQDIRPVLLDWLSKRERCTPNELNHYLDLSMSVPLSDLLTLVKGLSTP